MADSEETNLDIETVPVGSGSGAEFSAEPFNLDYALGGGILFAKDNSTQNTYYVASEFDNKSGDTWYRYRAKIRNKFYNFNNKGEMAQGKYTLYCGEGTIDTAGAEQGDMHKRTEGSTDLYYFLNSLNYRETVASSVLNAMIGHIADPLSYSESTIKLLVKKSFQFAVEFMNQAIALRKNNDVEINESEEPVPAETPTEMLLHSIATKLDALADIKNAFIEEGSGSGSGVPAEPTTILTKITEMSDRIDTMKNAVYDDSGLVPTSLLTELSSIKSSQENIAEALYGSGSGSGSGLMSQLSAINLNTSKISDLKDAIIDPTTQANKIDAVVNKVDNMTNIVANQGSDITAIKNAVTPGTSGNLKGDIETIKWKLSEDPGGNTVLDNINQIKNALSSGVSGNLKGDVEWIRWKLSDDTGGNTVLGYLYNIDQNTR